MSLKNHLSYVNGVDLYTVQYYHVWADNVSVVPREGVSDTKFVFCLTCIVILGELVIFH